MPLAHPRTKAVDLRPLLRLKSRLSCFCPSRKAPPAVWRFPPSSGQLGLPVLAAAAGTPPQRPVAGALCVVTAPGARLALPVPPSVAPPPRKYRRGSGSPRPGRASSEGHERRFFSPRFFFQVLG